MAHASSDAVTHATVGDRSPHVTKRLDKTTAHPVPEMQSQRSHGCNKMLS